MEKTKRKTARKRAPHTQPKQAPFDTLARVQAHFERPGAHNRKITAEEAAELVEWICDYDDDQVAWALIRIMNGFIAVWNDADAIEYLAFSVKHRAYTHTLHFEDGLDEFGMLDADNPRDKRVIFAEYHDDATADETGAAVAAKEEATGV